MNVKEFISETLKQIVEGVVDAQEFTRSRKAVIVPHSVKRQTVSFDVAVTVLEGAAKDGKAGISVWSIGAAYQSKSESSSSTVSRIKFDIPVELPEGNKEPRRQTHADNDYERC